MSGFLVEPTRWKDRTDQANLAERAVGQHIRSLHGPEPLSTAQLARIAARIRSERSSPRPMRLWLMATAALVLCGATVASAAHMKILPVWLIGNSRPQPSSAPASRPSGPKSRLPMREDVPVAKDDSLPVATEPSLVEPAARETESVAAVASDKMVESAQSRVTTRKEPSRPLAMNTPFAPLPRPVVSPSQTPPAAAPLAEPRTTQGGQWALPGMRPESRSAVPVLVAPDGPPSSSPPSGWAQSPARYLSDAIRALRVEQSPDAALALLDLHAPTLNTSDFRHEALILRVEALLKLHRQTDVLQLLDATPLTGVAASRVLLLTRGELRAAAGRCTDSLADFDRVLEQTQGHDRRALLGIANCRKQTRNEAGAGPQ